MNAKRSVFSEGTLIPVSLVVTFLGLAAWVGNVAARADDGRTSLDLERTERRAAESSLSRSVDEIIRTESSVAATVAGIDAKLDMLLEHYATRRAFSNRVVRPAPKE